MKPVLFLDTSIELSSEIFIITIDIVSHTPYSKITTNATQLNLKLTA